MRFDRRGPIMNVELSRFYHSTPRLEAFPANGTVNESHPSG